jgi:hypothetical protein
MAFRLVDGIGECYHALGSFTRPITSFPAASKII